MSSKRNVRPGIPANLTWITTRDDIALPGVTIEPIRSGQTAIIVLHGLHSSFARGQERTAWLRQLTKQGIGLFVFNTRGHDLVARSGRNIIGGGFERFTDCLKDIEAMIAFAKQRGYRRIILMGHSTGSNKALYYTYKRPRRVTGLILTSPISDIAGAYQQYGKKFVEHQVDIARKRFRKDRHATMAPVQPFMSAARYISLYAPGQAEDVFPYYRSGNWRALNSVRCPLLVVVGAADTYLDRQPAELCAAFIEQARQVPALMTAAIPRADHSFRRHERELLEIIEDWLPLVPR